MIAVILDGGPFDGTPYEVENVPRFLEAERRCAECAEHNVVARYYPTDEVTADGRLVLRYEAP